MKVLLSIKPEFVKKIFSGEKKYEYRKVIFKKAVSKIVVYSTKPEAKLIGEFSIEDILCDTPEEIWKETKKESGISYSFFKSYFQNHDEGYAIKIGDIHLYSEPIDPKLIDHNFRPPQSFCYVDDDFGEQKIRSRLGVSSCIN
ncbi:ASCH domain-containing protein [Polycladomyces sp. WAk]|uniref:ASCH domain-containing protein n=1 Tax=Polycladomyces zharkentensis TaxID=2807616 RepID=A0ABS2WHY8_9BACL|nr:ASCH domain-containing protein [Polycladomyces sp. WAk]MBN2909144.1 ASCH domain-containing protein [Polycladomyces sp. WAk]